MTLPTREDILELLRLLRTVKELMYESEPSSSVDRVNLDLEMAMKRERSLLEQWRNPWA